jgi:hypothetical protein
MIIVSKFRWKGVEEMAGRMIEVDGFRAFRGMMRVYAVVGDLDVYGDWLYRPDTDCWYCGGKSYPSAACVVLDVE